MASPLRRERVAEEIRAELSEILQHEMRDPRMGWVTVTRVEMSPDLAYAKVFVSIYGSESDLAASLGVLERAAGFIRAELGRRVRLRQTPELHFRADDSIEQSQRIQDLLNRTPIPPETPEPGADA
jgi:ribosome-binding factor A